MAQFRCRVDDHNRAVELPVFRIFGAAARNPHMRAFWGGTLSFFAVFLGWFALTPLEHDVATSLGICENQLYPAEQFPRRRAYLTYRNLTTMGSYCPYGLDDSLNPTDCKPVPAAILAAPLCNGTGTQACVLAEQKLSYQPSVLSACVCAAGTFCANSLADSATASVSSTILTRAMMGFVLERFGPVNVQCVLLTVGAIWLAAGGLVSSLWQFIVVRFFIGVVGAGFVTDQFWTSHMFAPRVVGSANSLSAGWGNLGGGVTQIVMPYLLVGPLQRSGVDADRAWRLALLFPVSLMVMAAVSLKLLCWDSPKGRRLVPGDLSKSHAVSLKETFSVLTDLRVVVMAMQYGACFGAEIAMYNRLSRYLSMNFQMRSNDIALMTSLFGLTNLFSRPCGGVVSDMLALRSGLSGRIWLNFWALFSEALFLFVFGSLTEDIPVEFACLAFLVFSISCEVACGTVYGIVPFLRRSQLASVSAVVGAGGNLGAVIAQVAFYRPLADSPSAFKAHAGYVLFWALLTPVLAWRQHGGMCWAPEVPEAEAQEAKPEDTSCTEFPAPAKIQVTV